MVLGGSSTAPSHGSAPVVIISTLHPLGGNYGGILQAYALQRVVGDLGHAAYTIDSPVKVPIYRMSARILRFTFRKVLKRSPNPKPRTVTEENFVRASPRQFVDEHIRTIGILDMARSTRREVLVQCKAILVGSDQVWRGGYANLPDQLLEYAKGVPVVKASYAASFGADEPIRYSRRMLKKTRMLASEFTSLSVREASGVEICRRIWGRNAIQHVDPALLLPRSTYERLILDNGLEIKSDRSGLFSYILDYTPATEAFVVSVAQQRGLEVTDFFDGDSVGSYGSSGLMPMPSVQEWLKGFAESQFVVTDSFHGTVFAIVFNKPFITIANRDRGVSRFESLLSLFGLQDRLVDVSDPYASFGQTEIDWPSVGAILESERLRSIAYLRSILGRCEAGAAA